MTHAHFGNQDGAVVVPSSRVTTQMWPARKGYSMYNGQKSFDVHGHVTAPDAYRAAATGLMASNTPQNRSVLMRPDADRPGPLRDENFKQLVLKQHVEYMDERNIDVQIIGPRPFIMLGWMPNHEIRINAKPRNRFIPMLSNSPEFWFSSPLMAPKM